MSAYGSRTPTGLHMARRRRYYSEDDCERGITPSQLKRAGRARQKEYMRYWFYRNFEDPANETPYNSEEGGYLFIWGGPYDAREELYAEFEKLVPDARIDKWQMRWRPSALAIGHPVRSIQTTSERRRSGSRNDMKSLQRQRTWMRSPPDLSLV